MGKGRIHISIVLMVLAIIAIAGFQAYWLYNTYKGERQRFRWQTNLLFRETVFQCQVAKLNLDSSVKFRQNRRAGTIGIINALRRRWQDSMGMEKRVRLMPTEDVIVDRPSDSLPQPLAFYDSFPGDRKFVAFLQSVDSAHDSITVDEVSSQYAKILDRENIHLPFTISRREPSRDQMSEPDFKRSNEVMIGFLNPILFRVDFENTLPYLLKEMTSQFLISFLLIGLTVGSFIVLLRNLMRQRRLTDMKNDFISNITHELKTPIATLSVAIEALKNFNALKDPDRTREYLDISGNELQRLSLLVDKVLKLSMFENQQIQLNPEQFNLKQLALEVISSMRLQFEKYQAQVTLQNSGSDFEIQADRLHISSIIFNLLDNALKYSRSNPEIVVGLREHPDHVELYVKDNGAGIPAEYKDKVFEKFFRVPMGDTHNVKGYGLGLSYVRYVVDKHRGEIELRTVDGQGSTFVIKLPKDG